MGPALVGLVADSFGGDLDLGLLCGAILPLFMTLLLVFFKQKKNIDR